jgi:hypothetical protein
VVGQRAEEVRTGARRHGFADAAKQCFVAAQRLCRALVANRVFGLAGAGDVEQRRGHLMHASIRMPRQDRFASQEPAVRAIGGSQPALVLADLVVAKAHPFGGQPAEPVLVLGVEVRGEHRERELIRDVMTELVQHRSVRRRDRLTVEVDHVRELARRPDDGVQQPLLGCPLRWSIE